MAEWSSKLKYLEKIEILLEGMLSHRFTPNFSLGISTGMKMLLTPLASSSLLLIQADNSEGTFVTPVLSSLNDS